MKEWQRLLASTVVFAVMTGTSNTISVLVETHHWPSPVTLAIIGLTVLFWIMAGLYGILRGTATSLPDPKPPN